MPRLLYVNLETGFVRQWTNERPHDYYGPEMKHPARHEREWEFPKEAVRDLNLELVEQMRVDATPMKEGN